MDLHAVQMQILKELLFHPKSRFSDLNVSGLTNDHFSYHVKMLVEQGLVVKKDDRYSLTTMGKEFANRMDVTQAKIEKQPKVTMVIIPERQINGILHLAIQTRTKEPYFGYTGFITGKIRYGETVTEAAARELMEEMGLKAAFEYLYLLHEMVYDKQGKMFEDKFFNVVRAFDVEGELVVDNDDGHHEWMTEAQFLASEPLYHNEKEIYWWYKKGNTAFQEHKYYIDTF